MLVEVIGQIALTLVEGFATCLCTIEQVGDFYVGPILIKILSCCLLSDFWPSGLLLPESGEQAVKH